MKEGEVEIVVLYILIYIICCVKLSSADILYLFWPLVM